jgi:lipid-binding SYLF domain-containing protein
MKHQLLSKLCGISLTIIAATTFGWAQKPSSGDFKDASSESNKAAKVFHEIMDTPDKAAPKEILDGAECIAVFPDVLKAGFIVGGRGGHGVASCRTQNGWSSPAYFDLKGGSIGLQIGAQSTDFVMLFMNKEGLRKLMGDKFEIGGDASVAAGPVGRQVGASTNVRMDAEILSYSRSKGVFAGLELKGVVISNDDSAMKAVYGEDFKAKQILRQNASQAPEAVQGFPSTLNRYSPRKGATTE